VSAAARERRAVAAPTVLFLVAGGCWALTVARMRGMDMGPGTDLGSLGWFVVVWTTMMAAGLKRDLRALGHLRTPLLPRDRVVDACARLV
jgi:hypothetical protein